LNSNDELDGYIVQLPLPKHIDEQKILMAIDPNKDVDGFHPANFENGSRNGNVFYQQLLRNHAIIRTL
jgi:methylenetetrahydrofolate dehydrogenase (NADP+)/methenyltetrahydrofolate cyclohydrolase